MKMTEDFSIGDSSLFVLDFPIWSIASKERLKTHDTIGSLLPINAGDFGRCLLLFPDYADVLEAFENLNDPDFIPVKILYLENLIFVVRKVQSEGDNYVGIDVRLRDPIEGRFIPIQEFLGACYRGLADG